MTSSRYFSFAEEKKNCTFIRSSTKPIFFYNHRSLISCRVSISAVHDFHRLLSLDISVISRPEIFPLCLEISSLLLNGLIGDEGGVGHLLPQGVEHLLPVVVEAAVDLVDVLVLDDPQLAVGVADQTLVVGDDDHAT